MTKKTKIRPGYRSGKWTAIGFTDEAGKVNVVCECGSFHNLSEATLIKRSSYQCLSCHSRSRHHETLPEIMGADTYEILTKRFRSIVSRCENELDKDYKHYGARGIGVGFQDAVHFAGYVYFALNFQAGSTLEIDRIDNAGDYAPGNIRLADRQTQNINRRTTIWLTYNGEDIHAAEFWRQHLQGVMSQRKLYRLLDMGISAEEILECHAPDPGDDDDDLAGILGDITPSDCLDSVLEELAEAC